MSETKPTNYKLIGHDYQTPDIVAKVLGQSKYSEDFRADGMLFAKLALSPVPHGRIKRLDASKALAMPGVVAILTADEVPVAQMGVEDPPQIGRPEVALTNEPMYAGEPIFAIAAVDEWTAAEAIEKSKWNSSGCPSSSILWIACARTGRTPASTAIAFTSIRRSRTSSGPPRTSRKWPRGVCRGTLKSAKKNPTATSTPP